MATTPVDSTIGIEGLVIHKLIDSGQTVVDVSGGGARWLQGVLAQHANIRALLYASPDGENAALGAVAGSVRSREAAAPQGTDLDRDTRSEGIRHIHFLHIEQLSHVRLVLLGASGLLRHSRINYLHFPLDTYDLWTAKAVNKSLVANNYCLFTLLCSESGEVSMQYFSTWDTERSHQVLSMLAVHERLMPLLHEVADWRWNFDPCAAALQNGIALKGVIHIGAYDGAGEFAAYEGLGFKNCLMIEANPSAFERLKAGCQSRPGFIAVNKAILDRSGPVSFHLTDFEQSSSLLKLGTHRELYPWVSEAGVLEVDGITVDGLLPTLNLDPALFNVMYLDIQGAELLALRGASQTLPHIDLVITEVSFENLYDGCAQVDEIDQYLEQFGFRRVATLSDSLAWGDGIYAKFPVPLRALPGVPGFLYD